MKTTPCTVLPHHTELHNIAVPCKVFYQTILSKKEGLTDETLQRVIFLDKEALKNFRTPLKTAVFEGTFKMRFLKPFLILNCLSVQNKSI